MIAAWPIVSRADLVRAFRPGTIDDREGPLRTLRDHHRVSRGVNVRARSGGQAAGSLTCFSWLNVEAARAARRGDDATAELLAKEAEALESSPAFKKIAALLGSVSAASARAVLQGFLPSGAPVALDPLLRSLARKTEGRRDHLASTLALFDAVFGKISRVGEGFVELTDSQGEKTRLSRALAESAGRTQPGDYLVVLADQLGSAQVTLSAPALNTDEALPRRAFNPFERPTGAIPLTLRETRLLSRPPKPRKLRIPVAIGE